MRTRWTDDRLDELAETLRPLPAEVAGLRSDVAVVRVELDALRELPAEVAEMRGELGRLRELPGEVAEMRGELGALRGLPEAVAALRSDLSATQRQMVQIAAGLAVGLLGTNAALVAALVG